MSLQRVDPQPSFLGSVISASSRFFNSIRNYFFIPNTELRRPVRSLPANHRRANASNSPQRFREDEDIDFNQIRNPDMLFQRREFAAVIPEDGRDFADRAYVHERQERLYRQDTNGIYERRERLYARDRPEIFERNESISLHGGNERQLVRHPQSIHPSRDYRSLHPIYPFTNREPLSRSLGSQSLEDRSKLSSQVSLRGRRPEEDKESLNESKNSRKEFSSVAIYSLQQKKSERKEKKVAKKSSQEIEVETEEHIQQKRLIRYKSSINFKELFRELNQIRDNGTPNLKKDQSVQIDIPLNTQEELPQENSVFPFKSSISQIPIESQYMDQSINEGLLATIPEVPEHSESGPASIGKSNKSSVARLPSENPSFAPSKSKTEPAKKETASFFKKSPQKAKEKIEEASQSSNKKQANVKKSPVKDKKGQTSPAPRSPRTQSPQGKVLNSKRKRSSTPPKSKDKKASAVESTSPKKNPFFETSNSNFSVKSKSDSFSFFKNKDEAPSKEKKDESKPILEQVKESKKSSSLKKDSDGKPEDPNKFLGANAFFSSGTMSSKSRDESEKHFESFEQKKPSEIKPVREEGTPIAIFKNKSSSQPSAEKASQKKEEAQEKDPNVGEKSPFLSFFGSTEPKSDPNPSNQAQGEKDPLGDFKKKSENPRTVAPPNVDFFGNLKKEKPSENPPKPGGFFDNLKKIESGADETSKTKGFFANLQKPDQTSQEHPKTSSFFGKQPPGDQSNKQHLSLNPKKEDKKEPDNPFFKAMPNAQKTAAVPPSFGGFSSGSADAQAKRLFPEKKIPFFEAASSDAGQRHAGQPQSQDSSISFAAPSSSRFGAEISPLERMAIEYNEKSDFLSSYKVQIPQPSGVFFKPAADTASDISSTSKWRSKAEDRVAPGAATRSDQSFFGDRRDVHIDRAPRQNERFILQEEPPKFHSSSFHTGSTVNSDPPSSSGFFQQERAFSSGHNHGGTGNPSFNFASSNNQLQGSNQPQPAVQSASSFFSSNPGMRLGLSRDANPFMNTQQSEPRYNPPGASRPPNHDFDDFGEPKKKTSKIAFPFGPRINDFR